MLRISRLLVYSFGLVAGMAFFASCSSSKKATTDKAQPLVIYPAPPEPAKIQFLTKITSTLDLEKKQGFMSKFLVGEEKPKAMVKPYGLAIHKGKIYVCDQYGGGMEIIDLEKRDMEFFHPDGKGRMRIPINCDVDEDGTLYVADAGRFEIVIFDKDGNYLNCFGLPEKFKPTDVCVHGDKIYVANMADNCVNVFSKDSLKAVKRIPDVEPGSAGFLCSPANITVKGDKLYAADFGCSRVMIYDLNGVLLDSVGSQGDRPGQFAKVKGIAVDDEYNLYAVDAAFENIQVFNSKGQLLIVFGGHFKGNGDLIIPAKIMIDYDNLNYFERFVDPSYDLKYLIFVTSQYGPNLINVYGRVEPKAK
ncbi:MAG: hypothetical protein U0X76_05130 [Bacteroidia bacterium]